VLHVPKEINLPSDSVTRITLLSSLRGWLTQKKAPDKENAYIMADDLPATSAFMDEVRKVDQACYLTNVIPVDSGTFRVQFAYMGVRDTIPSLRMYCTLLAKRKGDRFYFSSPLSSNTMSWKMREIGNCRFHYKNEINIKRAEDYQKKVAFYDSKLSVPPQVIDFYCCDGLSEAMRVVGVEYKSDYNGLAYEELSGYAANRSVVLCGFAWVNGFNDWDTHDTWHGRLHNQVSTNTINRPVDEACAYLYGGSWRIYGWGDVLRLFREYARAHPDADWLALYKEGANFIPPPKILKISYAINALIVQRLEKEKGFPAVMELLTCGKKEPGDANYFAAVRKLTGVDTAGYNAYVGQLLKEAK